MTDRTNPYTPDERRVVDHLLTITNGIVGGGEDPIGWFLASHDYAVLQRNEAWAALEEIQKLADTMDQGNLMARRIANLANNALERHEA